MEGGHPGSKVKLQGGFRIASTSYDGFAIFQNKNTEPGDPLNWDEKTGTLYTLNPSTGLAWTTGDVNGLGWWMGANSYAFDGDIGRFSELYLDVVLVLNSPTVATAAASGINLNSATLNGTIDPNGASSTYPVSYYFDWGLTAAYGNVTSTQTITGSGSQGVSAGISGLTGSTTYHFRLHASTAEGTFLGSDLTFTSGAADTVTLNF
jgi:hypothetical protein